MSHSASIGEKAGHAIQWLGANFKPGCQELWTQASKIWTVVSNFFNDTVVVFFKTHGPEVNEIFKEFSANLLSKCSEGVHAAKIFAIAHPHLVTICSLTASIVMLAVIGFCFLHPKSTTIVTPPQSPK